MAATDTRTELTAGLEALGLDLTPEQVDRLLTYQTLLEKWNSRFNLIGGGDLDDFVSRHLLDSLAIVPAVTDARHVLDVGSGGGLPGIPLAIALPATRFTLLDSNSKKTRFLFQAALALGLGNVEVENCRAEHYQSPRQIDIVSCRAFSSLADIVARTRQCFHPETELLAMKGRYPEEEIAGLPNDFRVTWTRQLSVPGIDSARHLIAVKMQETGAVEKQETGETEKD